jgi:hypothetical protein
MRLRQETTLLSTPLVEVLLFGFLMAARKSSYAVRILALPYLVPIRVNKEGRFLSNHMSKESNALHARYNLIRERSLK